MASTKYNQKGLSALLKIRHCGFDKQLQFGKSVFGFVLFLSVFLSVFLSHQRVSQ